MIENPHEEAIRIVIENKHNVAYYDNNLMRIVNKLKDGHYFHLCSECGNVELADWVSDVEAKLKANGLCHTCDFYYGIKENEKDHLFIWDNDQRLNIHADGGETKNTGFVGCGGALWQYVYLDDPETIHETRNMWNQGTVPKHLEYMFEANARLVRNYE